MNVSAAGTNGNNTSPSTGNGTSKIGFLKFLPAVQLHAQIQFRHLPDVAKEEAIAESVAAAFCGYASACQRGKEHAIHSSTLAHYSVMHAKAGRHVGGTQDSTTDVLSRRAQRLPGFKVHDLPWDHPASYDAIKVQEQEVWRLALLHDRRTLPSDQAAFRIDWSRFLAGQTDRSRTLLAMLGSGYRSVEIADHLGVTESAVCQRRKKAAREWAVLQGEEQEEESANAESYAGRTAPPVKTGPKRVAAEGGRLA